MDKQSGWKSSKESRMNFIVGNETNPTKFDGGEVIINKKATKKNLNRLVKINSKGSGKKTTDASDGGLLVGPSHDNGGIPGVVGGVRNIETEGEEFVVNQEASEKHWKELSEINQSTGGVPINKPNSFDEDPEEYSEGGKIIFKSSKIPNKNILKYAEMVRTKYPKVWDLGGNIFGNEAFRNLKRVSERGLWEESEKWMFIKWRSYVARHQKDFRIAGVIAMLKWVDTVDRGWSYMKQLIDAEIKKRYPKKMKGGGSVAQTPAPKKDRIVGSDVNKPKSSSSAKSGSSIKFSKELTDTIKDKIKEHNANNSTKKVTLSVAKAVVRRGMGAYSSSHRPTITGGKPNDRTAWGLARLNAFTYKIIHGKSKSGKYTQDDDLIEELGISVQKMNVGGGLNNYAFVESTTTTGKKVFKLFDYAPTNKEVFEYFKSTYDEKGNPVIIEDSTIRVETFSGFDRDSFLEQANKVAFRQFGSEIDDMDELMFSFDRYSLNIFPFEAELENDMEVTISVVDGVIFIEPNEKMKKGGNIEYQSRDLNSTMVYYKRKGGSKWDFISKDEFDKNANEMNTVKFIEGGSIESKSCIDFIKNSEAIKNNGHYLEFKNLNIYVGAGDKIIPKIKSLFLITYNSGGQNNLKAIDTINSVELANELAKLLKVEIGIARIIVSEQMIHSKPFTMNLVNSLTGKNIVIADRDTIVCNNISNKFDEGGSVDAKDTLTVDIPLMIRLLELSREDIKSDAELHHVAERLLGLKNKGVLTMDDYAFIAQVKEKHLKNMKYANGGGIKYPDLSKQTDSEFLIQDSSKFDSNEIREAIELLQELQDSEGSITVPEVDLTLERSIEYENAPKISSSAVAVRVFRDFWDKERMNVQEQFYVMLLTRNNKVLSIYHQGKGGISSTIADVELTAAVAVKALASAVIVAHNHPSGELKFSDADIKLTKKLKTALQTLNIDLLDSLVITEKSYISMMDEGKMSSFDMGGNLFARGGGVDQDPTNILNYKNPYEVNRAIERLIDAKGEDRENYTPEELNFINYYSGYGGLEKQGTFEISELKGLLYEYFTPDAVVKKMWGLAYKYGYGTIGDNSLLEPSTGIGAFLKYAPEGVLVSGNEINRYSATICRILYPNAQVTLQPFEKNFIENNLSMKSKIQNLKKYSLVIGNPPYGKLESRFISMGEDKYTMASNWIEYFIVRGLDLLFEGGLLIYIVGAEQKNGGTLFLDSGMSKVKQAIFDKADLVDAYRLPVDIFERTSVSSEILVFKKK